MELRPAEQDRRIRILTPTEKLHAHDRDWLVAHYAPLTVLFPQYDYRLVMRRDPQFKTVHRRAAVPFMGLGAKLLLSAPDMMLFLNHAAGYPVIAALLQAAMESKDYPHAAVPYAEVGDRFGVSRTHVRKVLVAAEERGLVKLHTRGGRRVEILPRLWSSHDFGITGGMYLHHILYVAATRQMAATKPQRVATSS
jgi:type IV secretory pathway TrbD component